MTQSSSNPAAASASLPVEVIRRADPIEGPRTGLSQQEAAQRVVEFYAEAQARLHLAEGAEPDA